MAFGSLLRFGPIGTAVLLLLPLSMVVSYGLSGRIVQGTVTSRPLTDDEQVALEGRLEAVDLPATEVVIATGLDRRVAGLGGTPWKRVVVLSESLVQSASSAELTGLVGLLSGKHTTRLPELYAGFLVTGSATFVALLGIDPTEFGRPLLAGSFAVGVVLLVYAGIGFLRRRTYVADRIAVRQVDHGPVEAAINFVDPKRRPSWLPDSVLPRPSDDLRLDRL